MENTIEQAIQDYINRGFGSMTKNDFEVWIFSQWLADPNNKKKSNYEISRELRIPETKVKKLRYEVDLRYIDKKDFEAMRQAQLDALLDKAVFDYDDGRVMFSVEDIALRQYIDHCLKENNRFSNTSFNREIVSISVSDYQVLFHKTDPDNTKINQLLKDARIKFKDDNITLEGILKKLAEGAAEEAGKQLGKKCIEGLSVGKLLMKVALYVFPLL